MGVHSLWDILGPTARPVRLESLSRRKLAVDASIWVYQFLKAVRDKEGNSLKNSHIVGFFRRICKLLYFGILPVFVFDGGAPILKKETIRKRQERRQGKKDTLQQTAQKLLTFQLQKLADEEYMKETSPRKINKNDNHQEKKKRQINDDELEFENYFEDFDYLNSNNSNSNNNEDQQISTLSTKTIQKQENDKKFKRQDEYHLPMMEGFETSENDDRMITDYEFKRLTEGLEDELEGVDLEKIDPASPEFAELPLSTQYTVLSHLRLRSRLRMGYTKEQLEALFPKSIDFSKFQISMVQKRNYLTQRLMNITGMDNSDIVTTRRVAGERGREYQLVKNEDGYTLSLNDAGQSSNKPIELDENGDVKEPEHNEDEDQDQDEEVEWEDVPIENSNSNSKEENTIDIDALFKQAEAMGITKSNNKTNIIDSLDSYLGVDSQLKRQAIYDSRMDENPNENEGDDDTNDEDYQQALFQSLQSKNKNLNENGKDHQMKKAIEDSKQKYFEMKEKEKLLNNNNNNNNKLGSNDEKLKSDEHNIEIQVPHFSLKSSMLFNNEANKSSEKKKDHQRIEAEEKRKPAREEQEREEPDATKKMNSPPIKNKPMPSWFNVSQVETGKKNPYNTDYSIYNQNSLSTEDEQAGLISAEAAQQYLQEEEAEEMEEDREAEQDGSDLEIIEGDQIPVTANEKNNLESKKLDTNANGKAIKDILKPKPTKSQDQESEKQDKVFLDYDFSESEEEGLKEQLEQEEAEHQRFTSSLNHTQSTTTTSSWSLEDEAKLQEQRRNQRRDADEVTQGMIDDIKDLLKRFGIPYTTAPMEAEAQCAELLSLKLVDGIITDDSDCFLFGGDIIYKNMFNEKNYVECYMVDDIERDLGLNREKLIELAILLGSDYTEGINGVGKVTAMEILAEFDNGENNGENNDEKEFGSALINFRNWWMDYQRGVKIDPNESSIRKKLRKLLFSKKLYLDNFFPNQLIFEAYLKPEVDHDKTKFQWGKPDLDKLRVFLMYNVGWSQEKIDQILVPVIKDLNKKQQTTINEFFPRDVMQKRRELNLGKRLKNATAKLSNNSNKRQKTS
ncbi:hypothetical protein PACTADRAFT_51863 [Pachysolen tannophilus NRRL Y-2460]|uniref:DNA repair protein RAD2 n=1 Tax=Pachysolen tannophilus NRRL Y-2460 TaxID=669874 RepID=A0A1E4TN96_PACTA|nr:hypothetical protein PACTADRAFT_51863 [Pachysolen tannophilus NRRL Y-2460]